MRSRRSVFVIAALLASSLMLAPTQLAEASADAPNCLEFISHTATLDPPSGASYGGPMSDDGRYVTFTSEATNLGVADHNDAERDVFVRDTQTGALDLVSQSTAGAQATGSSAALAITDDGRFVLFSTRGALVGPALEVPRNIYLRDRTLRTTIRISTDADAGVLDGVPVDGDLSADGRYVAYVTTEPHVVTDTNGVADVYRYDTVTATWTIVSVADDESQLTLGGDGVTMSGDGNLVLFHSTSIGNFSPGVRAEAVRDITAGTTRIIGAGSGRLTRDGRYAALVSGPAVTITDLVANTVEDVSAATLAMPTGFNLHVFGVTENERYLLIGDGTVAGYAFSVIDRVTHRAFRAGPTFGAAAAYLADGALVSSTSSMLQAYVWRGPLASVDDFTSDFAEPGTTMDVTVHGDNLLPGTTFEFSYGVSVSNFQYVSLTQATVTLTVAAGAASGYPLLTVTAPGGCTTTVGSRFWIAPQTPPTTTSTTTTSTTTTTLPTTTSTTTSTTTTSTTSTTTTIPPSTTAPPTTTAATGPAPHATSVSPALVRPGAGRSISITGTHFTAGATVSVDGVTVVSTSVLDAQHIVAVLSVPTTVDGVHVAKVTNPNGLDDTQPPAFVVRGSEGEFHSMQPYRAYDSRATQALAGQRTIQLTNLPATGVRAVAANLTVTGATADSYLTTYAAGTARPNASSINFRAGETKANMVTLPVNAQGQLEVYNFQGSVHVIIDVVGWYSEANTTVGSIFVGLDPFRRFDTRVDRSTALGAGEVMSIPIVSSASTVTAVMLNVTVANPTEASYLTVWPTGTPQPNTSNINYVAGDTVPNVVIVPIGVGGAVSFFNFIGNAHVIVDVLGVFDGGPVPLLGGRFVPTTPTRALDTRLGTGGFTHALAEHSDLTLDVGPSGVPADATAVVMNVTVAAPSAAGYLTVWPATGPMPDSSNLNFSAGQVTANLVVVPLDGDGYVKFFNAFGATHVIADVVGYYR